MAADCSSCFGGPPPVCDIFPARVPGLTNNEKNKTLLLRRRIRLQQEALVEKMQSDKKQEKKNDENCLDDRRKDLFLDSPLTGFEVNWILDEPNLVRFLKAREWHVGKAFGLLMEAVKYRRQMKAERIKPKEVRNLDTGGVLYRKGFDKEGHPIIYIRPAANDMSINDGETSIKLLVYMLERACQSMCRHDHVSAITFLIDYNKYTNQKQPPIHVALKFIDIFQNVYPERLSHGLLIDTPWYFSTFWNLISPFLPTRTVQKIKFINTSKDEERKLLFDLVDAKYLESWIKGGECNYQYKHEEYWVEEQRQFELYMRFLQDEFINKTQVQRLAEACAFRVAQDAGKDPEAARKEAHDNANKTPPDKGSLRDDAIQEEEGENEVQEEDESKESQELVEDEVKRKLLQEALKKGEDELKKEEEEIEKKVFAEREKQQSQE